MSKKKVYRVRMIRTVESRVDVIADSETDAEDMCMIGIGVKEDGEKDIPELALSVLEPVDAESIVQGNQTTET